MKKVNYHFVLSSFNTLVFLLMASNCIAQDIKKPNPNEILKKLGEEDFIKLYNTSVGVGYAARCIQLNGENSKLLDAGAKYNYRNQKAQKELLTRIKSKSLTKPERNLLDSYFGDKVIQDIKTDKIKCENVADLLNKKVFDIN